MDARGAQLRRAARTACNWLKRVRGAAVVRLFKRHVVELKKQLRMGAQHGFFQNLKSVQLEEIKKVESWCVRDEEGRLLLDKGCIHERWLRLFRSLLSAKSDVLAPGIPKRLPQHPVASALGIEPTEEEITTAMNAMANAKAVGPGGLLAGLLNSDFNKIEPSYWSSTGLPPSSGARRKSHSSGKTRPLLYSTRRATRRIAGVTAASRSCHTWVRFFLKWLPGDLAITVK